MCTRSALPLAIALICSALCPAAEPQTGESDAAAIDFFESRIRPVLVDKCYDCHSATASDLEGGLMLDSRLAIERGGESGKVIVPGNAGESRLIRALRYDDESLQMPPEGKLPAEVIADFEVWIAMGAPDPRTGPMPQNSIEARAEMHWAFRVPTKPARPTVKEASWPRNEIDYFVLARLEQSGIQPSPPADARTLVRRLYYDLTGLPPTFEQVESFERSPNEQAYEELVERLLESKQFGERWARYWLDVARFGDTKGYVFREDRSYPNAYKYRDWVINALNQNMPLDQFLKLQIAADCFPDEAKQNLAALGYLTLGRRYLNNTHDIIQDRIDVVFRGMMGLTVGCARCHDHKYDPISTRDYYAMHGVFESSREQQDDDLPLRLVDKDRPHDSRVLIRGKASNRGDVVPRRFPAYFSEDPHKRITTGSGRRELAEAITSRQNPLTARVFVNRVWRHLLGEGLVRTPSDFGLRSDPPQQQEVLDYLAVTLQEENSVKSLIRRIVLSSVYRQRSDVRLQPAQLDPENRLLWRANRRRLDFEAMRDSLLAVSGQLDQTVGGASVRIDGQSPSTRRTLYAYVDRQNLPGLFRTFDFASPDTHSPKRPNTTVPQQALYLMNSQFSLQAAEAIVQRLDASAGSEARIRQLHKLVLGREPNSVEIELAQRFLDLDAAANDIGALPSLWQFGFGGFNPEEEPQVAFNVLPHFTGDAWQGGAKLPDPKLGWVMLNASGGHPGNKQDHAAIRRWTAPSDGEITISGLLEHPSDKGDGVRGRIVSSGDGLQGEWAVRHDAVKTHLSHISVHEGDKLYFLTDCQGNESYDSFRWSVTIRMMEPNQQTWTSESGFRGPLPTSVGTWPRYAQTLFLTNEFMFLD